MLAVLLWLFFNTLLQCSELARLRIYRLLQVARMSRDGYIKMNLHIDFHVNYSLIRTTS